MHTSLHRFNLAGFIRSALPNPGLAFPGCVWRPVLWDELFMLPTRDPTFLKE